MVIHSRGTGQVLDGRREIISKKTKMKQRNPDLMEMLKDISETERIYIYWTPWSLGKRVKGIC